jgi:hypothetical protein
MKNFLKPAIFILICLASSTACSNIKRANLGEEQKKAQRVVDEYHKFYNEQNYEAIFNAAHTEARQTKSKEALGLALAQTFEKYGKYVDSELVLTNVKIIDETEKMVEMAYRSKFELGPRNETFLIIINDQNGALHSIGQLSDEELEKLLQTAE